MKQKATFDALFFSYESVLTRFKRAKSEDTLNLMYRGIVNKANENLQGRELSCTEP